MPNVSISDDAEDFIATEWSAALADARVSVEDYHLIVCGGAPITGPPKAVCFRPGEPLTGANNEGGIVVTEAKLAEANDPANLNRHRVAVLEDVDDEDEVALAYLAGVLRHEIQHALQREVAPHAFDLYPLVDWVLEIASDGDDRLLRELFNAQPLEADAHAASSAYLRRRYFSAVERLIDGEDKYLANQTDPPGAAEHLVRRTVEFLHGFAFICNDPVVIGRDNTFADILDGYVRGAGDDWRELERGRNNGP